MRASNLPPGVTGREPAISGEWLAHELAGEAAKRLEKAKAEITELREILEDQAAPGIAVIVEIEEALTAALETLAAALKMEETDD